MAANREAQRAKLFITGGSQAVRLPRAFRMKGTEALIHREGRRIVLEPVEHEWSPAMMKILTGARDETLPTPGRSNRWETREELE
jgi:virulence-associated protein VagC